MDLHIEAQDEVFARIKEWKAMVENATDRRVKSIRTDR